jgi:hypothetical protein
MRINLHCHSNKSDGRNTPSVLIDILARGKPDVISLTDHDSISGIAEAKARCKLRGITLLPGIEFSVSLAETPLSFATKYTAFHLLAYGFELEMMKEKIKVHHAKMKSGVAALIRELKVMNYDISKEDLPDNDFWTSYNVAQVLVAKKYASNIWFAFDSIIRKAKNRRIFFCSPKEIIGLVHECKGLAFFAHPFDIIEDELKIAITRKDSDELFSYLLNLGIDGIEGHYQPYSQDVQDYLIAKAKKHNLLLSYGTDYHGGRPYKEATYIEVPELPCWLADLVYSRK